MGLMGGVIGELNRRRISWFSFLFFLEGDNIYTRDLDTYLVNL